MQVADILDKFKGEVRVFNLYDHKDVGIINTAYKGWVKVSYLNCEVEALRLEMLNTAVLSARIVIIINDADAGGDSGDVEEASKKDIDDLIDSIYEDGEYHPTEDEDTIRVVTEDYYDHQPLPGDENDFRHRHHHRPKTKPEPTPAESHTENDEVEDTATNADIADLMGSIYND